jgi:uncharacterized protein DUF4124
MHWKTTGIAGTTILAAVLLATAGQAAAGLYKWTDANGRVVYSDQPPPGNVKVETLQGPPPANPNAVKELANKEMEFKQRQLDKIDAAKLADNERTTAKERAENCSIVQGQLKQLGEDNVVLWRVTPAGERVAMDDAARRTERDRLAKWFKDSKCQG